MDKLWIGLGLFLVLIAIGAYFRFSQEPQQVPPPQASAVPPRATPPAEPAIQHPVQAPPAAAELPPLEQADGFVRERITELLGAKAVGLLQTERFVHRVVSTVDNLARPLAPPRMWPIRPTPGQFTVEAGANGSVIAAKNTARYAAFVALVESVDTERAVALYQALYPLFQRAYEALGFPGKYFNDRLVAVIDRLLATPEPTGPLKVELPEIQGALKPARPWLLYRFSDPALEGLSSGQKMLLRMGRENEKRLKAKLAEIRKLIAAGKAAH